MKFNENLTELMQKKNINNNQLSLLIGVSRGMITEYKQGKSMPSFDTLEKIKNVLECDYNDLLK